MSASAPSTSPRLSTSGSRRENGYHHHSPTREQEPEPRSPPSSARSPSTQGSQRRPPSASRQAQLASVARRDFEQSNLQQPPARRSSSLDGRHTERPASPSEQQSSTSHRTPSRSRHSQHYGESPGEASRTNGASEEPGRPPTTQVAPRRRTTVSTQTGQWALGKTIGAGSMGKVKLARNLDTGETAAIKIVPRYSQDSHRSQQERERADHSKEVRTAREAAIVTLVNHPYICGMRDVVRTSYHWYMLFEYVNGGQMLDYIISHGRLKEKPARKFARQIGSALDYCHRNSIVHRDLKIENILISKSGDIKIIDFGLSNLFSPRSSLKTFCGSLYFAAPELLQARQYTGPEVDIWSFGIVLYVLVCGKVPFDDQSMPQLHAKIKKGIVEYPNWLSTECKHLISRMLVTDPRQRAPLSEIINHPWMNKSFNGPADNFLPHREPLQLPLDPQIIEKMTGFDFGSTEYIARQLEATINSEEYQRAVRQASRRPNSHSNESDKKKPGVFDFYNRRKSAGSRDALATPSSDTLTLGEDPVNAFSPLISIYYLVREKQERDAKERPGTHQSGESLLKMPDLPAPDPVHTNSQSYEMPGEAPTGGRTRPRARTHDTDELKEELRPGNPDIPTSPPSTPATGFRSPTKLEAAAGIFRRFSTRKPREGEGEKEKFKPRPPPVEVSAPADGSTSPQIRSSFSVRKREPQPPSAFANVATNHPDLLMPPSSADGTRKRFGGLGRSTSVNTDVRRRFSRRGTSEGNAAFRPGGAQSDTEGTESTFKKSRTDRKSEEAAESKSGYTSPQPTSTGLQRGGSVQRRRLRRPTPMDEEIPSNVPEETDQELAEESATGPKTGESQETLKPIYLKGLFSVSTTSSKPLGVIRGDIIRALKHLNIQFSEIKSGFSCKYAPDSTAGGEVKSLESKGGDIMSADQRPMHKRKISFVGLRGGEKEQQREETLLEQPQQQPVARSPLSLRTGSRRNNPESSFASEEESHDEGEINRNTTRSPRPVGETTTRVQDDMGKDSPLRFEILVVKVPFLSLHGLQFKKVHGGTWQYKKMADAILAELKL